MVKKNNKDKGKKRKKKVNTFNIKDLKNRIKKDLYSQYVVPDNGEQIINTSIENKIRYYTNIYSKYINEEFNTNIVNMLLTYINESKKKSFPKEYQTEPNFYHHLINLIRRLLMKEFDLVALTILLDNMGWKNDKIEHWTYLSILGIYSKTLIGREEESSLLLDIFSKDKNEFKRNYNYITEEIINKIDKNNFDIKFINQRFNKLTKPINTYCKNDFIDYNGVVDKIVKWSQPYGEENNGIQLYNEEQANLNNNDNIKDKNIKNILPIELNHNSNNIFTNNFKVSMDLPIIPTTFIDKLKNNIINNTSEYNYNDINV